MLCNILSIFQNIPADKQRLIFRGKVLQDDKLLSEYGMQICSFCKHCDNTKGSLPCIWQNQVLKYSSPSILGIIKWNRTLLPTSPQSQWWYHQKTKLQSWFAIFLCFSRGCNMKTGKHFAQLYIMIIVT